MCHFGIADIPISKTSCAIEGYDVYGKTFIETCLQRGMAIYRGLLGLLDGSFGMNA